MILTWGLLALSAVLYAVPFVASIWCWPVVFLFPLPLFYCLLTRRCGFFAGLWWGTISVGLHLAGVFYSIMHMAQGPLFHKCVPWIGGTLYFGVYIGLWFWLTSLCTRRVHNELIRAFVWLCSLWLLFISFDYFCLAIFNCIEGLFLLSPLLPIAECVPLLRLMAYITKPGLVFVFFMIPWALVLGYVRHQWRFVLLALAGILVWVGTALIPIPSTVVPSWLSKVGFLTESFFEVAENELANAPLLGQAVQEKVAQLIRNNPQVELVVLPESALVRCPLNQCSAAVSYWTAAKLGKNVTMLVGAARKDDSGTYNTLYVIKDGAVIEQFDKRHAMLLTENIAPWWNFDLLHDLYFKDWNRLAIADNERKPLPLLAEQTCVSQASLPPAFVPYICSELFFRQSPDDAYPNSPIILLCNDTWVKTPYIKRLMVLEARLKAVQWQRFILYISFFYASYAIPL